MPHLHVHDGRRERPVELQCATVWTFAFVRHKRRTWRDGARAERVEHAVHVLWLARHQASKHRAVGHRRLHFVQMRDVHDLPVATISLARRQHVLHRVVVALADKGHSAALRAQDVTQLLQ